jgi:guanylate kinase
MDKLNEQQRIFVFTGPNGAGRKTVAEMSGSTLGIKQVVSYTTRSPRPGEVEGQDYRFISKEAFKAGCRNGEFLEVIELDGNYYGVKSADVERMLKSHHFIYLILNRHGAQILKELYEDRITRIFVYVDLDRLVERNRKRGDTDEDIQRYIAHYDEEMEYRSQCEHVFENIDLAHTVFDLTKTLDGYMQRDLLDLD